MVDLSLRTLIAFRNWPKKHSVLPLQSNRLSGGFDERWPPFGVSRQPAAQGFWQQVELAHPPQHNSAKPRCNHTLRYCKLSLRRPRCASFCYDPDMRQRLELATKALAIERVATGAWRLSRQIVPSGPSRRQDRTPGRRDTWLVFWGYATSWW